MSDTVEKVIQDLEDKQVSLEQEIKQIKQALAALFDIRPGRLIPPEAPKAKQRAPAFGALKKIRVGSGLSRLLALMEPGKDYLTHELHARSGITGISNVSAMLGALRKKDLVKSIKMEGDKSRALFWSLR